MAIDMFGNGDTAANPQQATRNRPQKAMSPRVLMMASRASPSAGSATYIAFSMRCQNGVAITPSNVTVDSMTMTNMAREWLTSSV